MDDTQNPNPNDLEQDSNPAPVDGEETKQPEETSPEAPSEDTSQA